MNLHVILTWIGFDQAPIRERIRTEGFESFEDLLAMKEKDIWDLVANSYARRSHCCGWQGHIWIAQDAAMHDRPHPLGAGFHQDWPDATN